VQDKWSKSVEGEYTTATASKPEGSAEAENEEDRGEEPVPIEICRGYSRDHRPDPGSPTRPGITDQI
jgi:hypothetical protein